MIRDIEDLIESIRTYLKSNLNTYIDAINTQKLADDSTTFQIENITADDDHYLTAVNIEDLPNRPFVVISLEGQPEVQINEDDYSINPVLEIVAAFQKPHNKYNGYIALRYMQSILNAMLKYESATNEVEGLQITAGIPMEVTANSRKFITGGISVSIKLA